MTVSIILSICSVLLMFLALILGNWAEKGIGNGRPKGSTPPGYMRDDEQAKKEAVLWKEYTRKNPYWEKAKSISYWFHLLSAVLILISIFFQLYKK